MKNPFVLMGHYNRWIGQRPPMLRAFIRIWGVASLLAIGCDAYVIDLGVSQIPDLLRLALFAPLSVVALAFVLDVIIFPVRFWIALGREFWRSFRSGANG